MSTNPSLDDRAAGRDREGSVFGARRERHDGEPGWFVAAILIVAAFFLIGYNERLPSGLGPAPSGVGIDRPSAGALPPLASPSG